MAMSKKLALLDFNKCRPEDCNDGICVAAEVCPSRLFRQEAPYEVPMPEPSSCRACGDCVRACPQHAINIATI